MLVIASNIFPAASKAFPTLYNHQRADRGDAGPAPVIPREVLAAFAIRLYDVAEVAQRLYLTAATAEFDSVLS